MVLFTDPRQVTNWLDPLEKNYTEQRRQRELHHSQSKEVWRQQEDATFTAGDFDNILKGLSTLSKTAKQISTDREERKYTNFVKGYEQLKFTDQEKIEQIASETDLSLNDSNLLATLKKSGVSPEALIYLEQQSGSKALRLKRLLGWQTVEKSIATIDSEIEQNFKGIRDNFNEAERTGKVNIFYKNVLTDKLRKLGLNDRFIATHYETEINKFSDTKGLSSKLDYKKVEFSKDAAEQIAGFEKLKYSTDPTTAAATFGAYLRKQIDIDPENGRSKAVIFMHRLIKDGKIDGSVIQAIKKGAYKSDVGKTGKDLISDSDWRYIEQGEREYQTAVITAHNDSWVAQGLSARTAVINNEWSQDQFEDFLRKAKDNGQENQQWYKDLSNININRQNEIVYNDEQLSLGTALISGNVKFLKQEKERVTNSTLKDQIQDTIDLLENKQSEFNYSERWIDVQVSEGLNLTLGKDDPLNQRGVKVRNDLLKFFRARFQARITEKHPDPMNEAMNDVKAYWDLHGGNVKIKPDNTEQPPGAGKFSPTEEGSYENYDAYLGLKRKRRNHTLINPTENDINNYKTRVETARTNAASGKGLEIPGKNTLERMLNTPKSILDVEDVVGAWENNAYSAELLIKAKQVGVLPSVLLWMQTNALHKAGLLKNLNSSQQNDFPIKERMVAQKAIDDAIKRSNNPSLLYLYRKVGFENMSQKQKQRLIDLLEKVKIETPSIESFNQIEQERRPESYTGISY
tara:strand:+ start:704 stop:2935 length:2232 start_codon:yes stop_codon:yes gene_type:complete